MFGKSNTYSSYKTQKLNNYKKIKIVLLFFILFFLFNFITTFYFSVWVIDNDTMSPELSSGDRVIFSSFNPPAWLNKDKSPEHSFPYNRGNIVLVDMSRNNEQNIFIKFIDMIVRFFTLQKVSLYSGSGQYYVKRLIALPGDEISMTSHVFRVKTSLSNYNLTEFELSAKPYHPSIPQMPALWDESLPFSGNMEPIILGSNECFVISDDRSNTNDSRTWGAIPPAKIKARAVLRFWPLNKIKFL